LRDFNHGKVKSFAYVRNSCACITILLYKVLPIPSEVRKLSHQISSGRVKASFDNRIEVLQTTFLITNRGI